MFNTKICDVHNLAHNLNLAVQVFHEEVKCGAHVDQENAEEEIRENGGQQTSV